jgi:hypothetical protein
MLNGRDDLLYPPDKRYVQFDGGHANPEFLGVHVLPGLE